MPAFVSRRGEQLHELITLACYTMRVMLSHVRIKLREKIVAQKQNVVCYHPAELLELYNLIKAEAR